MGYIEGQITGGIMLIGLLYLVYDFFREEK
mgnify:CR=1 FL=1